MKNTYIDTEYEIIVDKENQKIIAKMYEINSPNAKIYKCWEYRYDLHEDMPQIIAEFESAIKREIENKNFGGLYHRALEIAAEEKEAKEKEKTK